MLLSQVRLNSKLFSNLTNFGKYSLFLILNGIKSRSTSMVQDNQLSYSAYYPEIMEHYNFKMEA